jgi:hypothetical protein
MRLVNNFLLSNRCISLRLSTWGCVTRQRARVKPNPWGPVCLTNAHLSIGRPWMVQCGSSWQANHGLGVGDPLVHGKPLSWHLRPRPSTQLATLTHDARPLMLVQSISPPASIEPPSPSQAREDVDKPLQAYLSLYAQRLGPAPVECGWMTHALSFFFFLFFFYIFPVSAVTVEVYKGRSPSFLPPPLQLIR